MCKFSLQYDKRPDERLGVKTDSKEVEGQRCMRGSDRKLCFSEKERSKYWKDYIERIMNEENDRDQNVEREAVEGPEVCVSRAGASGIK